MTRLLLVKGVQACLTLVLAATAIFLLVRLAPGDPVRILLNRTGEIAMSDSAAFEQKVAELQEKHGLDRSLPGQFIAWVSDLVRLDLGTSIYTGREIRDELVQRLPATLQLTFAALGIQVALGLGIGVWSALRAGSWRDEAVRLACVVLASTPAFVLGLLLLSASAVSLGVYQISSEATWSRLWLPALTMGVLGAPSLIRTVRANLMAELGKTYVVAAWARGLGRQHVVRHALRHALLPIVTLIGVMIAGVIGGAVVIESIFSWPGLGKYAMDSILVKDYPAIQGYALLMVALVIAIHAIVELLYAWLDPRIRRSHSHGKVGRGKRNVW